MRYFIHLGYDGTNYRGWQRQKNNQQTVQEVIEDTLSKLLKKTMTVHGCGRTDAGVHASQYVMQIDLDEAPAFDLKFRLNKNLPNDIAIFEIFQVDPKQHCQHHAAARTYDYFIHWKKDPVLLRHSSFYEDLTLDFDLMQKAAALILQTKDFKPLCKQPDLYDNTICKITRSKLYINKSEGRMRYQITSNRFLKSMVRYCVFFILEVGSGTLTLDQFEKVLNQQLTIEEKRPVYSNGLFLSGLEYPFLELSNAHYLIKMMKVGLS